MEFNQRYTNKILCSKCNTYVRSLKSHSCNQYKLLDGFFKCVTCGDVIATSDISNHRVNCSRDYKDDTLIRKCSECSF